DRRTEAGGPNVHRPHESARSGTRPVFGRAHCLNDVSAEPEPRRAQPLQEWSGCIDVAEVTSGLEDANSTDHRYAQSRGDPASPTVVEHEPLRLFGSRERDGFPLARSKRLKGRVVRCVGWLRPDIEEPQGGGPADGSRTR